GRAHVGGDLGRPAGVERRLGPDHVLEGAAVDVLHDDEVGAVLGAGVVDGDHPGMRQAGRGLGLAPEPLGDRGVGGGRGQRPLDGHPAGQKPVTALEHLGHAAGAEQAADLVAVQEPLEGGGHGVSSLSRRLLRVFSPPGVDCARAPLMARSRRSLTSLGLARPRVSRMTWPTMAPSTPRLPPRNLSARSGLAATTRSTTASSSAVSEIWARPLRSTMVAGGASELNISASTSLAAVADTVPAASRSSSPPRRSGPTGFDILVCPNSRRSRWSSPITHP